MRYYKIKDVPWFGMEHAHTEGEIEIPQEEVNEFLKQKLKAIIENPRLFEKYYRDIEMMLEDDLEEYAKKEFYEKGRGSLHKKDSKSLKDEVVLFYKDLPITVLGKYHKPTWGESGGEPGYYEEIDEEVDFEFEVDEEYIIEALIYLLGEKEEFKDIEEKEFKKYIEENLEDLIEEHKDILKEYFLDQAIEAAEEYYQQESNE